MYFVALARTPSEPKLMEPMYSENASDVFIPNAHGSVKKASKLYFFLVDLALDLAPKIGKSVLP